MADERPIVFDDDNPEWTAEDVARARPLSDFPELAPAFSSADAVTVRLDRDVASRARALGAGWEARVNDLLRASLP